MWLAQVSNLQGMLLNEGIQLCQDQDQKNVHIIVQLNINLCITQLSH